MTETTDNLRFIFAPRPEGLFRPDDFGVVLEKRPALERAQALVRQVLMFLDPAICAPNSHCVEPSKHGPRTWLN